MCRAGMPEPFLGCLNPAGFPVNQLGRRPAQNVRGGSLNQAGGIDHCQILFYDLMRSRPGEWARDEEFGPSAFGNDNWPISGTLFWPTLFN
jgi:hypothetical protein